MEKQKRSIKTIYFAVAILLGSAIALQSTPAVSRVDAVYAGSSQTSVLCPAKGVAQVALYSDKLEATGKKVDAFSPVQVFQGWGTNEASMKVRGAEIRFVRVQIPGVSGTPFVRELEVATTAACQQRRGEAPKAQNKETTNKATTNKATTDKQNNDKEQKQSKTSVAKSDKTSSASSSMPSVPTQAPQAEEEEDEEGDYEEQDEPVVDVNLAAIIAKPAKVDVTKGLKSANCCLFPLVSKPTSYLSGKGRFGAGRRVRRGNRMHAGADLYGKHGQNVRAVSGGTIIRAPYYFKGRTFAIDVRHTGGFVVRYGEIMANTKLKLGQSITRGEKIGQIKKLPCCSPMLHFELYTGGRTGKLSQPGANKYHRRSDLVDPTPYLKKWSVK